MSSIHYFISIFFCVQLISGEISPRIDNGKEAAPQQFPWHALLKIPKHSGTVYCGGALISDQWILTAAQCVYHEDADVLDTIEVMLGSIYSDPENNADTNYALVNSTEYIIHEQYNYHVSYEYEVAVIKLPEPVTFDENIQPIELATEELGAGVQLTLSAFGAQSFSGVEVSPVLQYADDLLSISNNECWGYNPRITPDNLCIIGQQAWVSIGDGGSPLVQDADTNPIHVGMPIWSIKQAIDGYTRTAFYRDWIREKTGV